MALQWLPARLCSFVSAVGGIPFLLDRPHAICLFFLLFLGAGNPAIMLDTSMFVWRSSHVFLYFLLLLCFLLFLFCLFDAALKHS